MAGKTALRSKKGTRKSENGRRNDFSRRRIQQIVNDLRRNPRSRRGDLHLKEPLPEPKPVPDSACVCCGSAIVPSLQREYNPLLGPPVIGPGSVEQTHVVQHGFHCAECGLCYHFPPKLNLYQQFLARLRRRDFG